jgi:hypothetical protein
MIAVSAARRICAPLVGRLITRKMVGALSYSSCLMYRAPDHRVTFSGLTFLVIAFAFLLWMAFNELRDWVMVP